MVLRKVLEMALTETQKAANKAYRALVALNREYAFIGMALEDHAYFEAFNAMMVEVKRLQNESA